MAVSHMYPVIDFTLLDYDKIPVGTFLIGFDSSNGGKLCKMDHVGTITIIETGLLPSLTGLNYQGLWNANINFPTLTSSVGTAGDFYIVSVLGTTNLNGITDWQVGDWAIFEGGAWLKVDNHDIQAYNTVKDESTILPQRSVLKFTGAGVTASDVGSETQVNIPIQPAYSTVKDEGSSVTQRSTINFIGGGVTASDVAGETQVSIPTQQAYTTIQEEGINLAQTNILDFQGAGVTASAGVGKTIVTVPIQPAYSTIQEEGSALTQRSTIDFQGLGVTATDNGAKTIVTVPIQPAYSTVKDEGILVTQRNIINFVGEGVTASDVAGETQVSIPGNPVYRTTSIATATHSASFAYEYYGVTYSGGICTVTLPLGASPSDNGKFINIADEVGSISWANRGILVQGSGGQLINGETSVLMKIERMSLDFMFRNNSWKTI